MSKTFFELIYGLEGTIIGNPNIKIENISINSKEKSKNSIFIAVKGSKVDGHDFIDEAISNGNIAVICEKKLNVDIPQFIVNDSYKIAGIVAARLFNFPSISNINVGITGTAGKTTSTFFLESILKEANLKPAVFGTVEYRYFNEKLPAPNTTPNAVDLQKLMHKFKSKGANSFIMEVSSHSLKLGRVNGTYFDAVAFTNLSPEHQEFHINMEDYYQTKKRLFTDWKLLKYTTMGAINIDDEWGNRLKRESLIKTITFGKNEADLTFEIIEANLNGTRLKFKGLIEKECHLKLPGEFNIYNAMTAASLALILNIDPNTIIRGLENLTHVPGRFEKVNIDANFTVVVDYAHTSDSLKKLLELARSLNPKRIITVFGCGGDRAKEKRPVMGSIAVDLSDFVIITSDNPRTEDPERIIKDILTGITVKNKDNWITITDRRQAISKALQEAKEGDLVVIAGKGHETYQIIGHKKIHFDDREEVIKAWKEINR